MDNISRGAVLRIVDGDSTCKLITYTFTRLYCMLFMPWRLAWPIDYSISVAYY